MTMRNLLAFLSGEDETQNVVEAAFRVAVRFDAHVVGLHVKGDLAENLSFISDGMSQGDVTRAFENARGKLSLREAHAKEVFDRVCERLGVAVWVTPSETSTVSAAWQVETGNTSSILSRLGRVHDLLVLSSVGTVPGGTAVNALESALFQTGRPVLVAPHTVPQTIGDNIFIAWNRSAQSARAVAAAMPLIERATKVTIGYVDTGVKKGPSPEELAASLAWHGVQADVRLFHDEGGSIAELLVSYAENAGADLMVMGAYSHARFQELVLGGVTNHTLRHVTLPALMAH
jgi:nucleotide-binding universal stress UspA family protein